MQVLSALSTPGFNQIVHARYPSVSSVVALQGWPLRLVLSCIVLALIEASGDDNPNTGKAEGTRRAFRWPPHQPCGQGGSDPGILVFGPRIVLVYGLTDPAGYPTPGIVDLYGSGGVQSRNTQNLYIGSAPHSF